MLKQLLWFDKSFSHGGCRSQFHEVALKAKLANLCQGFFYYYAVNRSVPVDKVTRVPQQIYYECQTASVDQLTPRPNTDIDHHHTLCREKNKHSK